MLLLAHYCMYQLDSFLPVHPYMHQSRITGKISLQWKGFRRSDWNLHTHSSSSSAALPHFCSVCLCVQHINDLTSSVKNIRFSRVMRQFLFCSASLQIDFSGAAACRLIIQRDLDSCMTRQRLDTRKPHVFLSFGGGAVALQRYSCQPLPLVINQFPANKEFILLFKIPPTPPFLL